MKSRIAATAIYGAVLGSWFYLEQKQIDIYSQGVYDFLHSPVFGVAFLLLPILVGWLVARWWVLASLIGPLATLGYLQGTGFVSSWHDGAPPLGLPNLVALFFLAFLLLLGAVVGSGFVWRGLGRGRPVDPQDDWTWGK